VPGSGHRNELQLELSGRSPGNATTFRDRAGLEAFLNHGFAVRALLLASGRSGVNPVVESLSTIIEISLSVPPDIRHRIQQWNSATRSWEPRKLAPFTPGLDKATREATRAQVALLINWDEPYRLGGWTTKSMTRSASYAATKVPTYQLSLKRAARTSFRMNTPTEAQQTARSRTRWFGNTAQPAVAKQRPRSLSSPVRLAAKSRR